MMMTMIMTMKKMMMTIMPMTIIMVMMHTAIKVYYKLIGKIIIVNENECIAPRIPKMCELFFAELLPSELNEVSSHHILTNE